MGTSRIISRWWIIPAVIIIAVVPLYVLTLVFPSDNNAKWVQRGADVAEDLRPLASFLKDRAAVGVPPPRSWEELSTAAAGEVVNPAEALQKLYPDLEYFGPEGMVDGFGNRWILLVPTDVPGDEWAGITAEYEVRFLRAQDRYPE